MSLRQLEYFVATASHRTITAAARKLGVSQSTLSQQLSELERIVGARLLVRHSGGVTLTEAGRVLAGRAQRVLTEVGHAVLATRAAAHRDPRS
ncbi:LysR family transcriptional regulator [Actinocrispum wychmicini]|uniref:LysR family transcriptional regulator n=1 Tax=Actinocrispum wychmicini TaxID=1213861 RepID=UPI001FB78477|nr:LysR family transcriptional regulator [Actinocrispum wychmicini]